VLFGAVVALFFEPPPTVSIAAGLNVFAYYRAIFGYRAYGAMLPTLVGHALLLGLLVPATPRAWNTSRGERPLIGACWAMVLLGAFVGAFHGGAFPYFWMTLGFFPAVAAGLAWPAIVRMKGPFARSVLLAAGAVTIATSVPAAVALQSDTQLVQRGSLDFISRNFSQDARGFQAEGALSCRIDPHPFPAYFADRVIGRLSGAANRARLDAFISEFRTRPVQFMIAHRLFRFPVEAEEFWAQHYVRYAHEVLVAGRAIAGAPGLALDVDVIVPGRYRWIVPDRFQKARLRIDDREMAPGEEIALSTGTHKVTLLDSVDDGMLVLSLRDDPTPQGPPFYAPRVVREIDPRFRQN
jgi:hypothetical protein